VAFGSSTGVSTTGVQLLAQGANGFQGSSEPEDAYGSALAVGGFGKTSEEDLAIGVPVEDVTSTVDAGAVFIEYGSPTGIIPNGQVSLIQGQAGLLDTPETGDNFGASLAA